MSKCPYCDFNSHVNDTVDIDLWIKSYTNQIFQMKEDIKKYNLNLPNKCCLVAYGNKFKYIKSNYKDISYKKALKLNTLL